MGGCRQHIARPCMLMDEIAYRGHKRTDIDGQSDIASLILPPFSLTHSSSVPLPLLHLLSPSLTHTFSSLIFLIPLLSPYYLSQRAHLLSLLGLPSSGSFVF